MTKYNVKKIENTNTLTTTLSTVCKKQTTAVNRFTRFLEACDSRFTETMLKCFMNMKILGYVNGELILQATIEENDYTMIVQISDNTYIISIEFKHYDNTTSNNTDTKDTESDTESGTKDTESDTNITATDSADNNETETTGTNTKDTEAEHTESEVSESNNTYIVKAYKNCKELTVPCSLFNKREYAIDYIQALSKNGVVDSDVVFTINNQDIYNCFNDVKLIGTTAQIKYATDILNGYYKRLCYEIALEQKIRVDDVDCKDYYANLNAYVAILKKVLTGNSASDVIKNKDKFEIWGNIYGTATNFITSYEANCPGRVIKHLESKLRKELFGDIKILF